MYIFKSQHDSKITSSVFLVAFHFERLKESCPLLSPISCPCLQWGHIFKTQRGRKPCASIHLSLPASLYLPCSHTNTHSPLALSLSFPFSLYLCVCLSVCLFLPLARAVQSALLIQGQSVLSLCWCQTLERSAVETQLGLLTRPRRSYAWHLATSLPTQYKVPNPTYDLPVSLLL